MSRVDVMSDYLMHTLFGSIVPIYDFHCGLLKELDQRLAVWLGGCWKLFLLTYCSVDCLITGWILLCVVALLHY